MVYVVVAINFPREGALVSNTVLPKAAKQSKRLTAAENMASLTTLTAATMATGKHIKGCYSAGARSCVCNA